MNITTLDILYIALSIGFISLVVFVNIILYNIIITIRSLRHSVENIHNVTKTPVTIKNKVKLAVLKGLSSFLNKIPR